MTELFTCAFKFLPACILRFHKKDLQYNSCNYGVIFQQRKDDNYKQLFLLTDPRNFSPFLLFLYLFNNQNVLIRKLQHFLCVFLRRGKLC